MRPSVSYNEMMLRQIAKRPGLAAEILKSAMSAIFEGDFHYGLSSLRDIVKAGMGFAALSKAAGIPAPNLHRALSPRGNPTIKTLNKIVTAIAAYLGVDLAA